MLRLTVWTEVLVVGLPYASSSCHGDRSAVPTIKLSGGLVIATLSTVRERSLRTASEPGRARIYRRYFGSPADRIFIINVTPLWPTGMTTLVMGVPPDGEA